MKSFKNLSLLILLLMAFINFNLNAQSANSSNLFDGKWKVDFKDLPAESTIMVFNLVFKEGNYTGTINDEKGKEIAKIDKSETEDYQVTVYFSASGYDVNVVLKKVDDDHISGNMMGMFEGKGERIK